MESKVEYKVIEAWSAGELETLLNQWGAEGWNADRVSLTVSDNGTTRRRVYVTIMSRYHAEA